MAAAQMPSYMSGDKFYFSSGLSHKVTGGGNGQVKWLTSSKRTFTTSANIFAPEIYLESRLREYAKSTPASANAIWPLVVGKEATFVTDIKSVSKVNGREGSYSQKWSCSVDGTENIRVLAGSFNTFRVACKRNSITGRRKWRQTITYYYAPEINHYVLRENRRSGKKTARRELTAVRPGMGLLSEEAARGFRRAFQEALENKNSGEAASYRDPKTNVAATITPVQTFRATNGKFCRNYKQVITQGAMSKTYAGVACREGKRKWLTPKRV